MADVPGHAPAGGDGQEGEPGTTSGTGGAAAAPAPGPGAGAGAATPSVARWVWNGLAAGVAVELVLGVIALVLVPVGRPSALVPRRGVLVYDLHAAVGGVLVVGAGLLVLRTRRSPRVERAAAVVGLVSLVIAAGGGLLTTSHPQRLLGIALMFVGSVVAGLAFLAGAFERTPAVGAGDAT